MATTAVAFAPATVANVAVGFDILGHSIWGVGDRVTARRVPEPGVRICKIVGASHSVPLEPMINSAGIAAAELWKYEQGVSGIELVIEKGIPVAAGLGGSAASAVAAVLATNELLSRPLDSNSLIAAALKGESAVSGSAHLDNISPCMLGGLVLTVGIDEPNFIQIPVPSHIRATVVHPHLETLTRESRRALNRSVSLSDFVWQTANLAGFISGCYSQNLKLIQDSFIDVVIEPQRTPTIHGFDAVKRAALEAGAIGLSISGSGPSVFAWSDASRVDDVRVAIVSAFVRQNLVADSWITPIAPPGAYVEKVS